MSRRPVERKTEEFSKKSRKGVDREWEMRELDNPSIIINGTSYEIPRAYSILKSTKGFRRSTYTLVNKEHTLSLKGLCMLDEYMPSLRLDDPLKSPGLTNSVVSQRRREYGKNVVSSKKKLGWFHTLWEILTNCFGLFQILLILGGTLCWITFFLEFGFCIADSCTWKSHLPFVNAYLGILLYFIVIATSVITYFQRRKRERIRANFGNLFGNKCVVIRSEAESFGIRKEISNTSLTVGDVVMLEPGDRVPADVRIFHSSGLKIDKSTITGETKPVPMSTKKMSRERDAFDANNMAYLGTHVAEGNGHGVVVATGQNTLVSRLVNLVPTPRKTPLQKELNDFVVFISLITAVMGIIFFLIYCFIDIETFFLVNTMLFATGIIVANVPEGILSTIAFGLSLASKRLRQKDIVIKDLNTIEVLSSATVVCADKTNLITENKMTVSHLYYNDYIWKCKTKEEGEEEVEGEEEIDEFNVDSNEFLNVKLIGSLCNNAVLKLEVKEEVREDEFDIADELEMMGMGQEEVGEDKEIQKLDEDIDKKEEEGGEVIENIVEEVKVEKPKKVYVGDACDVALLNFFERVDVLDLQELRKENPVCGVAEIKFNSENRYQTSLHQYVDDKSYVLVMKGAMESVVEHCKYIWMEGKVGELEKEHIGRIKHAVETLARKGERVIALAINRFGSDHDDFKDCKFDSDALRKLNFPGDELIFVGLVSFIDPIKEGVKESVKKCREAGVRVVMVTGDHSTTAETVAKEVGILTSGEIKVEKSMDLYSVLFNEEREKKLEENLKKKIDVMDSVVESEIFEENPWLKELSFKEGKDYIIMKGNVLEDLSDRAWNHILAKKEVIFSRTSPFHKLLIVKKLQRLGEIVIATGDSAGDAPALRKANIGISMGKSGSDISKHCSDIIVTNDSFSTIVDGIEEGRRIFDNLKKSIAYSLASNIPEIIPLLLFTALGIPLPVGIMLILFVDLVTDVLPALSFMYEPAEFDIMKRPPRSPRNDRLVSPKLIVFSYFTIGIIQALAGIFAYSVVMAEYGFPMGMVIIREGRRHFLMSEMYEEDAMETHPLKDYYGVRREYDYQQDAVGHAQTAVFVSIIVTQIAHLIVCRTGKYSIFQSGIFSNPRLIYAIFAEIFLALLVIYVPFVGSSIFGTRPLRLRHWFLGLPFALLIFVYDEYRKALIRISSKSWFRQYALW